MAGANFNAGNQSKGSLYAFLKSMGGELGSAQRLQFDGCLYTGQGKQLVI